MRKGRAVTRLSEAWARAVTAELCWIDPDGSPAAIAVTPVLLGSTVCAAVPYARAAEVAGLRSAGSAAFAVTDSRSLAGTDAVVAAGTVTVTDDVSGDLFTDELLEQELAKYPPSRTLADSVLLRRENWWWLPRIVVRLDASAHPSTLPARTNPARHALLVTPAEDGTAPGPALRRPRRPRDRPSRHPLRRRLRRARAGTRSERRTSPRRPRLRARLRLHDSRHGAVGDVVADRRGDPRHAGDDVRDRHAGCGSGPARPPRAHPQTPGARQGLPHRVAHRRTHHAAHLVSARVVAGDLAPTIRTPLDHPVNTVAS